MRVAPPKQPRSTWPLIPALVLPWVLLALFAHYHHQHTTATCRAQDAPAGASVTGVATSNISADFEEPQLEAYIGEPWREPNGLPSGSVTPETLVAPADCSQPPPSMAFLHIPKTGGSSVVDYLHQNLGVWCDVRYLEPSLTFTSAIRTDAVQPLINSPRHAKGNCTFSHLRAGPGGDARPAYAALVLGHGFKLQHVMGHLPFGYCRLLDEGCTYVSMLREPVQRLASHWGYLRHAHPDLVTRACGTSCDTLAGFATALAQGTIQKTLGGLDNMQTRMIAGDAFFASISGNAVCRSHVAGCDNSAPMRNDRAMLDMAKSNLVRHFKVVGLLEDLPGFMDDMDHAFCFKKRHIPVHNRLGTGQSVAGGNGTETQAVLAIVRRTQGLDIELYDFAKELIAERRAQRAAAHQGRSTS